MKALHAQVHLTRTFWKCFDELPAIARNTAAVAVSATRIGANIEQESQDDPEPAPTVNAVKGVINKDVYQCSKGQEDNAKEWPDNGIVESNSHTISE